MVLCVANTDACLSAFAEVPPPVAPGKLAGERFGRIPLYFVRNEGQAAKEMAYYGRTARSAVWFTSEGIRIALPRPGEASRTAPGRETRSFKIGFAGASPDTRISGEAPLPGTVNYFYGNDPGRWKTGISTFGKVRYRDVYPNTDFLFYGNGRQLEYDIVLGPGAQPGGILFSVDGVDAIAVDAAGALSISFAGGKIIQPRPRAYQTIGGTRRPVPVDFVLRETGKSPFLYSFRVGAYDHSRPLVIDPLISYSSYLGGASDDYGTAVAVDSQGNAYVTGYTLSTDFPATTSPLQGAKSGNEDVFVAKINAAGSSLLYATYLGGGGRDYGTSIAVDGTGAAYVTGSTFSGDFPTKNPLQSTNAGGLDIFIAKLAADGSSLVYSTYLGGDGNDSGYGIAVDGTGIVWIGGETWSTDFPTASPIQASHAGGGSDVVVAKIKADGSALLFSTFFGGSGGDSANDIALTPGGAAYLAGTTSSTDFPVRNAYQSTFAHGNDDAFALAITAAGTLGYATYLGGSGEDAGFGIDVDVFGRAVVAGSTASTDFPTRYPVQGAKIGFDDVFITKLSPDGGSLIFSTYIGGNQYELAYDVAMDGSGNAFVTGYTNSSNFPGLNGDLNTNGGGTDAFILMLGSGGPLAYSSYFGGTGNDYGMGVAVNAVGPAYVIGDTFSDDLPTTGPFQGTKGGSRDAFVAKLAGYSALLHTLTVTKTGTGSGTVASIPAAVDCGAICAATFAAGSTVDLSATPDPGSVFLGWSGNIDCADGSVNLSSDVLCTADFEPASACTAHDPAYIDGAAEYPTAQAACDAALDNDLVKLWGGVLTGALNVALGAPTDRITLRGGWNCNYTQRNGGRTIIDGGLTITRGTVDVDGVTVK